MRSQSVLGTHLSRKTVVSPETQSVLAKLEPKFGGRIREAQNQSKQFLIHNPVSYLIHFSVQSNLKGPACLTTVTHSQVNSFSVEFGGYF